MMERALNFTKNLLVPLLGASLMMTTSCDDDDGDSDIEPVDIAYVSLYQASPNAPGLGISVDDRMINAYSFDYTENTGYLRFYTGDRSLEFMPWGANNVVSDTTVTFVADKAYSVFLGGEYPNIDVLILDDNAEAPGDGEANIRVVNMSPDAGTVDLKIEGEESALFEDQASLSGSDFTSINAQGYDFVVTTEDGTETILDVPDINLSEGFYYTVLIRGYETPPSGSQSFLSAEVIVN